MNKTNMKSGSEAQSWQVPLRSKRQSMLRGLKQRCPACGTGRLYGAYLKVNDKCPECGEELHHHRADDAPPYFTILIVAHIVGAGILWTEQTYAPPTWVHWLIWLPLLLVLSLGLLPRIKGALIGLQWALRMHGFGGPGSDSTDPSVTSPLAASKPV
ncbi:MAG: DUF983 domain-containing protein [Hyphomicrobium sp.]